MPDVGVKNFFVIEMPKYVTCKSRDARKYAETHSLAENWAGPPQAFQKFYRELLDDSDTWDRSENEPVRINYKIAWEEQGILTTRCDHYFWLFKNRLFDEPEGLSYTIDELKLLVFDEFDKERRLFEKLHAKFSGLKNNSESRAKIPSNVRIYVWQRDSGRCVECGSNENLEYDHIIPFAKGGSNTDRNIQLLCGKCNRLKSANIQ